MSENYYDTPLKEEGDDLCLEDAGLRIADILHFSDTPIEETVSEENVSYVNILKKYEKDFRHTPLLTAEQEKTLARQMLAGDQRARDTLITSNLRLVLQQANHFRWQKVPLLDLIQEGNIGLMKAVKKFDPERGWRFSTCAVWWIRQAIIRYIENTQTIRVPIHITQNFHKYNRAEKAITAKLGRKPLIQETAKLLGIGDISRLSKMLEKLQKTDVLSLEELTASSEYNDGWDDFVRCDPSECPENICISNSEKELAMILIDKLCPREREIIILRYGINGNDAHTLKEIGVTFGISRERVRQIEKMALKKLKRHERKLRETAAV